jgi:putative transposase
MSRLRRLAVTGRIFFITCNVSRKRLPLGDSEFEALAAAMERVRRRRGFLTSGYVFMPDHWHALIIPRGADTLPRLMEAIKIASSHAINRKRGRHGPLWQARYYDRVMRDVKEYRETLDYMHANPVRKGLVRKLAEWPWSSFHAYGGPGPVRLKVDLVDLPADEKTRL